MDSNHIAVHHIRRLFVAGPRVWSVIACLWFAAAVAMSAAWHFEAAYERITVPWWVLLVGFALADSFPIHVQFRSESSSFSLYEVPLVFGLMFSDASALLVAMLCGSMFALVFVRRQPSTKLAFNGANQLVQTSTAVLLFNAFEVDPLTPMGSLAALASVIVASQVCVGAIATVIVASEGRLDIRKTLDMFWFAVIVAAANASLALVAAVLIVQDPWAASFLLLPLAVVYGSYRAFVSERTQREQVEFLYTSTKSLQDVAERNSGVSTLLMEVATMFRASRVDLLFFAHDDPEQKPTRYSLGTGGSVSQSDLAGHLESTAIAIAGTGEALLSSDHGIDKVVTDFLASENVTDAMIAPLRGDSRIVGLLVAADRVGAITRFTKEELLLFDTLCHHAAIALENDRLEHALVQLRVLESELSHQATHDTLTGLPNRLLLRRHLDKMTADDSQDLELLFIDLDDFKLVNDTLGHACGDQLLAEVARRIAACLRPEDLAARLGGDEFAVVLPGTGHGAAIARRLIAEVQKPFTVDNTPIRVGCSIGIASAIGPIGTSKLLLQADVAMYAAKEKGKGQLAFYSDALSQELLAQRDLHQALVEALDAQEFGVRYQPVYDIKTGRMVGAEALVRWESLDGMRLPAAFLATAETSRLIVDIDRFVLSTVLEDVGALQKLFSHDFWTSINLSPRHLQTDDLVEHITTSVLGAGIEPSRLVLEITETAVITDISTNVTKLETLDHLGFRIALDDFGTGFSSITHLRRFPVSILKIAQVFIDDLAEGDSSALVAGIIELSHKLGLQVVAEGVAQPNQLVQLGQLGCDMGQGFLLNRPLTFAQLRNEMIHHKSIEHILPLCGGSETGDPAVTG